MYDSWIDSLTKWYISVNIFDWIVDWFVCYTDESVFWFSLRWGMTQKAFQPGGIIVYDCRESGNWRNQQNNFTLKILETGGTVYLAMVIEKIISKTVICKYCCKSWLIKWCEQVTK